MKITIWIFLFLTGFINAQSPETAQTGLTESELQKAKSLFIKMFESENYKKRDALNDEFYLMVQDSDMNSLPRVLTEENVTQEGINSWIKQNVAKENVEKAIEIFQELAGLEKKLYDENKEVYELMVKANPQQLNEIYEPFFKKNLMRYGY